MRELRRGVCVLSPGLRLTITVEAGPAGDEVHLHPGGQGYWVARCIDRLDTRVVLCATVGGEVGDVLTPLLRAQTGIELVAVEQTASSSVTVTDRRSGHRVEVARTGPAPIDRHVVDKLYSLTLASAAGSQCCVLTGNVDTGEIPTSFYGRLCDDLATLGVPVLADLHGPELDEIVESDAVALLKVSDEDLRDDGVVPDGSDHVLAAAVTDLAERAPHDLVVTRGPDRPAAMRIGGAWYRVSAPRLMAVDWRGSGDAMTGAMAVAKIRGGDGVDIGRFGAAAGAASVARRGIASLDADLVEALFPHVVVEPVDGPEAAVAG